MYIVHSFVPEVVQWYVVHYCFRLNTVRRRGENCCGRRAAGKTGNVFFYRVLRNISNFLQKYFETTNVTVRTDHQNAAPKDDRGK